MSATKIKELEKLIEESGAYAASVFGSYARGEEYNDIDIAVFTEGNIDEIVREATGIFDIPWFSDLPLYIKQRVLEEGEVLFVADREKYYDDVFRTIKEYEDFRPRHNEYLEGVKSRR